MEHYTLYTEIHPWTLTNAIKEEEKYKSFAETTPP